MEATILLGILGAGYLINKSSEVKEQKSEQKQLKPQQVYNTDYFDDYNKTVEHPNSLTDKYKTVKIPGAKVMNYQNIKDFINPVEEDPTSEYIYSLFGDGKIKKADFLTNNMGIKVEPFFKKAPPQIDLTENTKLSEHQGNKETYFKNKEKTPLFPNEKSNMVFGASVYSDEDRSSIYVSDSMKNILPFEQIQEHQIDDKNPVIGDIQRQYYEKSSIDNIRTLNNQQLTYGGRILPGKGIGKAGKIGQVFKHTPESDYFNSPDKWLVTNGAYIAKTERPEQIVPNTNRQFFNKQEFGIAGGDHEAQEYRSKYAVSSKQTFAGDIMRNLGTDVDQMNNTTVKDSYQMYPNERDVTSLRTYDSNISSTFKDPTSRLMDPVRNTVKQTTINSANNGYIAGPEMSTERLYDEIRNTKKQFTSADSNYIGISGTNVPQPVNEDNYKNMETNPTKEIIAQGRYPTPQGEKYYNSKETYNIEIKKNENDYFNHRQTHYDRMNPEYLPKNTCNFTQFKNKLNDASISNRTTDPNLLNAFKSNPYTQSLESFAY